MLSPAAGAPLATGIASGSGAASPAPAPPLYPVGINYEIIVVDDSSTDRTPDLVRAEGQRDPRIRLIERKGERGLSGAVLDGWRATDADVLAVMDADLQHPPELLPRLYQAIVEGRDMAIGSRYTAGGQVGKWNPVRKLISFAATAITWPIQHRGARASDPMSGFFMVRRSSIGNARFQRTGFKLLLEILVRGRIRSVREIPFTFGTRYRGVSKANLKVAWDYGLLLLRLYAARIFGRSWVGKHTGPGGAGRH
jgi:dolichol-phosphate mannosyltransferase